MIKCKMSEIAQARFAMRNLGGLGKEASIADRTRVSRFIRGIRPEMQHYEEALTALARKYGKPIEGAPGMFQVLPEKQEEYNVEKDKLEALECELLIERLPIAILEKAPVTSEDLVSLGDFIVYPEGDASTEARLTAANSR